MQSFFLAYRVEISSRSLSSLVRAVLTSLSGNGPQCNCKWFHNVHQVYSYYECHVLDSLITEDVGSTLIFVKSWASRQSISSLLNISAPTIRMNKYMMIFLVSTQIRVLLKARSLNPRYLIGSHKGYWNFPS